MKARLILLFITALLVPVQSFAQSTDSTRLLLRDSIIDSRKNSRDSIDISEIDEASREIQALIEQSENVDKSDEARQPHILAFEYAKMRYKLHESRSTLNEFVSSLIEAIKIECYGGLASIQDYDPDKMPDKCITFVSELKKVSGNSAHVVCALQGFQDNTCVKAYKDMPTISSLRVKHLTNKDGGQLFDQKDKKAPKAYKKHLAKVQKKRLKIRDLKNKIASPKTKYQYKKYYQRLLRFEYGQLLEYVCEEPQYVMSEKKIQKKQYDEYDPYKGLRSRDKLYQEGYGETKQYNKLVEAERKRPDNKLFRKKKKKAPALHKSLRGLLIHRVMNSECERELENLKKVSTDLTIAACALHGTHSPQCLALQKAQAAAEEKRLAMEKEQKCKKNPKSCDGEDEEDLEKEDESAPAKKWVQF